MLRSIAFMCVLSALSAHAYGVGLIKSDEDDQERNVQVSTTTEDAQNTAYSRVPSLTNTCFGTELTDGSASYRMPSPSTLLPDNISQNDDASLPSKSDLLSLFRRSHYDEGFLTNYFARGFDLDALLELTDQLRGITLASELSLGINTGLGFISYVYDNLANPQQIPFSAYSTTQRHDYVLQTARVLLRHLSHLKTQGYHVLPQPWVRISVKASELTRNLILLAQNLQRERQAGRPER